jgi:hypothetical protein
MIWICLAVWSLAISWMRFGVGVVEDEGEVGFEVEEFGFELGDVLDLGDGLGVEVVVNAVAEFLGEFGCSVVVEGCDVEDDGVRAVYLLSRFWGDKGRWVWCHAV